MPVVEDCLQQKLFLTVLNMGSLENLLCDEILTDSFIYSSNTTDFSEWKCAFFSHLHTSQSHLQHLKIWFTKVTRKILSKFHFRHFDNWILVRNQTDSAYVCFITAHKYPVTGSKAEIPLS